MLEETNKIKEIVENIRDKYEEKYVGESLRILKKLFTNLLDKPKEEKYQKIKKTNENIKYKVLFIEEFLGLLYFVGYEDLDDEFLIFKGNIFTLKRAVDVFKIEMEYIEKILQKKEMEKEEEERKKIDDFNLKYIEEKFEQEKLKQNDQQNGNENENENDIENDNEHDYENDNEFENEIENYNYYN